VKSHQAIFTPQYTERSGPGSTVAFSEPYRSFVANFARTMGVETVVDLGCGDMNVSGHIDFGDAYYIGFDVIEERIRRNEARFDAPKYIFGCADLREHRPIADLVLVKDVIQHWSNADIVEWLAMLIRCPFRYALITNCNYTDGRVPPVNSDIPTGSWRPVDLTMPPFSIGDCVLRWGDPAKDTVLVCGTRIHAARLHD
jgi:hypothetical protein